MRRAIEHRGAAATLLLIVGILYVIAAAHRASLVGFMVRGWVLNPEAYAWWRVTSLYAVLDWLWMVLAALPMMICALVLARGSGGVVTAARFLAAVGIGSRMIAMGGTVVLWLAWDRSRMGVNMQVELLYSAAILVALVLMLVFLGRPPAGYGVPRVERAG